MHGQEYINPSAIYVSSWDSSCLTVYTVLHCKNQQALSLHRPHVIWLSYHDIVTSQHNDFTSVPGNECGPPGLFPSEWNRSLSSLVTGSLCCFLLTWCALQTCSCRLTQSRWVWTEWSHVVAIWQQYSDDSRMTCHRDDRDMSAAASTHCQPYSIPSLMGWSSSPFHRSWAWDLPQCPVTSVIQYTGCYQIPEGRKVA